MTTAQGEILHRKMTLEVDGTAKDKRQVTLAFSSEKPVERYFGIEVLDHEKKSVDMAFLNSGRAPLLVDHNLGDHVGVIERAEIASDRVGRAVVRFGNSIRADEIWNDVKEGIRLNVSVGYGSSCFCLYLFVAKLLSRSPQHSRKGR
ncbi:MAG: hypothetical protein HOL37_05500 [Rhodospirillaceae bacterium]|jgi:hypothetical protein|nr:hypothetical protein [Rhodospirillaceae bacterium]MBT4220371.1 hypothetical protein [Rhodospirillaceae bacterium]MBT4463174.1 hypothetical protein [Rhodospirillaceae bacterium]MBT5013556.1 hypothetical protein [Rhodospirillaceae bacterium]MBT5308771.1 hypothetical protein [Rhodospirillaceae bacterium]